MVYGLNTPGITVALVEDEAAARQSQASLVENTPGLVLAGVYANGNLALTDLANSPVEVVLMDLLMPGKNGFECARELKSRRPNTAVIMVSGYAHSLSVWNAHEAGAAGYILKPLRQSTLLDAIQMVRAGEFYISPEMASVPATPLFRFLNPAWILPRALTPHAVQLWLQHGKAPDFWYNLALTSHFNAPELAARYGRSSR